MSASPELQALVDAIPGDFADPAADYHQVRAMFQAFHGHPVGDDLEVDIVEYGGVRCGDYRLPDSDPERIAFHCHGGAFVSTPLDEYHFYAEIIARQTGCRVVMPDYRLAPEHPYPAAHDDCFNAWRGLIEQGASPGHVAVLGESCGGSLGLGLVLRLRDTGLAQPACFVSLTGWFDLAAEGAEEVGGNDPFLSPGWVRNRAADYLGGQLSPEDPAVSPARATLAGIAPLYLQVGEYDTLRAGAERLAANAAREGVEVTLEHWPGAVHGWHGLVNMQVPEAQAAWVAIRQYLADKLTG